MFQVHLLQELYLPHILLILISEVLVLTGEDLVLFLKISYGFLVICRVNES